MEEGGKGDQADGDSQQLKLGLSRKASELQELHLRYTYSNASNNSEFSLNEQCSSMEVFEYRFVEEKELWSEINEQIQEVKKVLFQRDDLCLFFYHYYHWSLEKLADCFFREDWTALNHRLAQPLLPLPGTCPICEQQHILFSSGLCSHAYCQNCWQEYVRAELEQGHIFFGCMNSPSCPQAPVLKSFVSEVAPHLRELYRRKIVVNYARQNRDISQCPDERCPFFCAKPIMMELSVVRCPCGRIYCFKCLEEPHLPANCQEVRTWKRIINSEEANLDWLSRHTRQCPGCQTRIEKKVGCSHMHCAICSQQFCFECNGPWDQPHQAQKGDCPLREQLSRPTGTSSRVADCQAKAEAIDSQSRAHESAFSECEALIKEETLRNKVTEVKVEVACAWLMLKWSLIVLAIRERQPIDSWLQECLVSSIRSTMQPVEVLRKSHLNLMVRQLQYYGERVLAHKEILKKNKNIWLEAFEAHNQV